jgi:hypothetical protein
MLRLIPAALCLVLAACGGGGGEDEPNAPVTLADQTVTASSGPISGGASAQTEVVDGPRFTVAAPAVVTVCATGQWVQQLNRSANLKLTASMLSPIQGRPSTVHTGPGTAGASNPVAFEHCQAIDSAAGNGRTSLRLFMETDCNCGADALREYAVTVRWTVTAQY